MATTSRISIIGRSLVEIAAVWGTLQSFFTGADLIVSLDPVGRALEGPSEAQAAVILLIDSIRDANELESIGFAPEWLLVLCAPALLQVLRAELKTAGLPLLSIDEAPLALMGTTPLMHQPSGLPSSKEPS